MTASTCPAELHMHSPLTVPGPQDKYPWLLLASIVLELTGGVLFVVNSALGAYLLVRSPQS